MRSAETYEVVTSFHCGETKLDIGTEIVFEGNRVTIDGQTTQIPNLRAGIKAGWLKRSDGGQDAEVVNPARSRYASVTTTEEDLVVGSATKRKNVLGQQFLKGAEAQAALEEQDKDAKIVGSVSKDRLEAAKRKLMSHADPVEPTEKVVEGIRFRDTRTATHIKADVENAQSKRALVEAKKTERMKTASKDAKTDSSKVAKPTKTAAEDALGEYPAEAHWKTRLAWLKENGSKSQIKRIHATSSGSFQTLLKKEFANIL